MKGSVGSYQTKAGKRLWRITYDLGPDPRTGKRRQTTRRGFERRRDAESALRKIVGSVEDGSHVAFDRQTVAEYLLDEWLVARKPRGAGTGRGHRDQVSLGTWQAYRQDVTAYVVPAIGRIRLQHLSPADINGLYDDLEASGGRAGKGLAAKTVANIHGVLHKALADALRQGKVTRNVAAVVGPPRAEKAHTDVWPVEDLRRFLKHVQTTPTSSTRTDRRQGPGPTGAAAHSATAGRRLYAMWLLFATTGMRRGEVAGLSWPDIDLDAGTVRITWTLGVVDSKPTWKPRPKSEAGKRTMALDPATVEALRAWRKAQLEERMLAGAGWVAANTDWRGASRDDVVFAWPDGRMINPERISKWFADHCVAAGLPRIRLHDVRHTYATAALANATGWHEIKVISQRLGHASVGITLDTYGHVLPAADEQTAHTLARVILG